MKIFSILLVLTYASLSLNAAQKPSFIFLLSDDQDWTGLSLQMHPDYPGSKSTIFHTPNIEKLASRGMKFTAAYAPAPVCSPTRISLQTGKSPAQLRWTKAASSVSQARKLKLIPPKCIRSISSDEITIAEMLKTVGYATAHYGKWHIMGGGPEAHGYDASDGETSNNDAAPFKGDNPVDIFGMGSRAIAFMTKCKAENKPFFIQMSYHALHYPENAKPETLAKYANVSSGKKNKGVSRAAITEDLDTGVGEIMDAIDKLGIAENTYIIYMSDNGGGGKGGGRPIQGGKGGVWEGGIRVPLIIRGPNIKANTVCHQRVVGYDLYPTLCALAGVTQPMPEGVEGGNFAPLLGGNTEPVKRPREELVFHFPHYQGDKPHSAIILGDYKAIKFYETGNVHLYNLAKDIGEKNNLAAAMPELTEKLETRLDDYLKAVNADLPVVNPDHVPGTVYQKKQGQSKDKKSGGKKNKKNKGEKT